MAIELSQPVVVTEPEREIARVSTVRVSGFYFVDEDGTQPFVTVKMQALNPTGQKVAEWSRRVDGEELAQLMAVNCSADKSRYQEIYDAVYSYAEEKGEFSVDNLRAVLSRA